MPGIWTSSGAMRRVGRAARLDHGRLRRHRHGEAEVALRAAEAHVAPPVGPHRADEGEVARDRPLHRAGPAVELADLLAFGQLRADAGRRVEGGNAGAAGADALGEGALRAPSRSRARRRATAARSWTCSGPRLRAAEQTTFETRCSPKIFGQKPSTYRMPLMTSVRSRAPVSSSALSKAKGTPAPPNPLTSIDAPSSRPSSAASSDATRLSIMAVFSPHLIRSRQPSRPKPAH